MIYTIRAKKDLFNAGQCFTKGKCYEVNSGRRLKTNASLMEVHAYNDQGEWHLIGSFWRDFEIQKWYKAINGGEFEEFKAFNEVEAKEWVNENFENPHEWIIEEE